MLIFWQCLDNDVINLYCRYSAVSPIYMSNDRLEPFNYHNIAFKRCADVVSLGRPDRLWFFRHHWFVKIGCWGKMGFKAQTCWTDLLAFRGVWNRSRILNFSPDRLFFRFSRALIYSVGVPIFFLCTGTPQPLYNTIDGTQSKNYLCCIQTNIYRLYIEQEDHGPRLTHLSDIATADMQMLCNIFSIISSQLMKRS